ncbi:GNAT family N-acetyltransferase [Cytophagales bacterium LB-30]|uniref:GNAT family N-acetyltransferase n=1 Tax=Shiella aurantiaca TaxID=3058365 RepID=A0ABT8F730_9BACT|nr:GNAT family N-acetyltransferase [Shiella aurantiaca]MDN4166190.1 GNAT family N-acetyltransferase [Shiella aurantiaca]
MSKTNFPLQPIHLHNDMVVLSPLQENDFETLYAVASDPAVWAQHPNKNRYERAVFQNFFKGALESGGAFLIRDAATGAAIGSSRFYEPDAENKSVLIGYTFYAKSCWGKGFNQAAKKLMLDYAFQFVDRVVFHVGAENLPSQKAMERLGAKKTDEITVAYYGEPDRHNFVYEIAKGDWK